jgi:hypothetical protein
MPPTVFFMSNAPALHTLTASPLRNRIRVLLNAPIDDVWCLVGDHTRLADYSTGIARVDVTSIDDKEVRVCTFHPMPGTPDAMVLHEVVRWSAPGVGYATSAEAGNPFGLRDDLSLVTVEARDGATLFTWSQYYEAEDLAAMRASFDEGLADIADNLIRRFGGRILERYVAE